MLHRITTICTDSNPAVPAMSDNTLNYIVAGGDTAVALPLTEDPSVSVLVVETGSDHQNDFSVLAPGLCALLYSNDKYN